MNRRTRTFFLICLLVLLVVLSACTQVNEPINIESKGIWNEYFVYPLSLLITYCAELFNGSYGLAIVVVTILARLILLPLNIKQIKSSKAMQEIQPALKELQEKYSSKDVETQQKLQKETMELFQKQGVNPLAGCLPMFIQMPILIAMYHAIMRTTAIKEGTFLWFELGSMDPILPIIAGVTTFIQQKLMMSNNQTSANPQMTAMLYVMPVMITVFAYFFPAALALYWVVGNLFMVGQTLLISKPLMKKEGDILK